MQKKCRALYTRDTAVLAARFAESFLTTKGINVTEPGDESVSRLVFEVLGEEERISVRPAGLW